MISTVYVVSLNVLLVPLLQKFWYLAISGRFGDATVSTDTTSIDYQQRIYLETVSLRPSWFLMKIALGASVSMLVTLHGVMGRLSFITLFYTILIFNVGWTLSYNVIYIIAITLSWRTTNTLLVFDEFGTTTIFFFGAMFGIGLTIVMNCKWKITQNSRRFHSDRHTIVWAMIGTAIIFSLFAYMGDTNPKRLLNRGPIYAFLAMAASIISCYGLSALIRGYLGIR